MNKPSKKAIFSGLIFFFTILFPFTSCAKPQILKAGASKSSITPAKDMSVSKGRNFHDELYVKTIVLDDGNTKVAFIVADNQGIPTWIIDIAKTRIQKSTGIPTSNIIISATHTHSGIVAANSPANLNNSAPNEYQSLLINKIIESANKAVKNLQPAKIGWTSFEKPEYVFNRRWYLKKTISSPYGTIDSIKTNPGFKAQNELIKPAGPVDPEIYILSIVSESNQPIAVLGNYSLHYVGGVGKNDISADYYGEFENQLKKELGASNDFIAIMSNGTSGDVNNNDYSKKNISNRPYEKIRTIATDIAKQASKGINKIDYKSWVPIKAKTTILDLNIRIPNQTVENNLTRIASTKSANVFHAQEKKYNTRIKNLKEKYPKVIDASITTFTIGDLAISGVPFEVFAETGLELKNKNPYKDYFTIGLANGHWGYLPTPNQFKKGGYETWLTVSRAEEEASEKIVKQILTQLKELKKDN